MNPREMLAQGQSMAIAVFVPRQPIQTSRGLVRAMWFGHVHPNVRIGPVAEGDQFGESYDSGIRFEDAGYPNARASHNHACASATGQLSPNGDMDGLAACEAMGWLVDYLGPIGPGPNHYMTNQYTAGRARSDFLSTGHALPPMPE
jgi:hypothetical protein